MQTRRHPPVHRIDCRCHHCADRPGRRRRMRAVIYATAIGFLIAALSAAVSWLLAR